MPSLNEIRRQYPQYNDLPDDALADRIYESFYADMPRDDFDARIGLTPGVATADAVALSAGDEIVTRGAVVPLGRTADGQLVFATPEFVQEIVSALKLPGDVLQGNVDLASEEGQSRTFVLSTLALPMGAAAGTGRMLPGAQTATSRGAATTATGQAAERLGIDLPRAVASDLPAVQQTGRVTANIPIGGQPVRQAAQGAQRQLGEAATRVEQTLGGGNVPRAGVAIEQGIEGFAGRAGILAERANMRFERVSSLVDDTVTRPLTETADVASQIAAMRTEAALSGEGTAVGMVREALNRPAGLTYEGLKKLRSNIGEIIDNPGLLPAGASQAELRRIYGALTRDLRLTVQEAGGDAAVRAFDFANRSFERTMRIRENLQRILRTDTPEAAFSRIEAMAGSTSRADLRSLAQARAALGDQGWNEVASALIAKIGRDADGQFSPLRFITAWGKLSDQGKRILFRTTGRDDLANALDDIVTVSRRFRLTDQFANPSGTGQTLIGGSFLAGAFADPLTSAGTLLGSRVLANLLAKPQGAAPFATWAKAYEAIVSRPSREAATAFANASKALAVVIAAEDGSDADALARDLRNLPRQSR